MTISWISAAGRAFGLGTVYTAEALSLDGRSCISVIIRYIVTQLVIDIH